MPQILTTFFHTVFSGRKRGDLNNAVSNPAHKQPDSGHAVSILGTRFPEILANRFNHLPSIHDS
jgi:hypothetical protein